MRNSLITASFIGLLLGLLSAQVAYFFTQKQIVNKSVELTSFRIDGNVLNPFHITQSMIDEIRGVNNKIDKTNILNNWKLIATYVSDDSAAMLVNGANVSVLRIDEKLEGFKLKAIKEMSARFENSDGKNIELFMDIAYTPDVKNSANAVGESDTQEFKMTQGSIENYLKKPEKLLKTVSVVPQVEGSVFQGLRVNGLQQYSFLYNFGVRKGDLIVGINGKKLNSINDALKEYQDVLNLREFEVTIKRNNQEKVMKYEVVN
ncbi:MAG: hypothetical protein ACOCP1_00395 [Campylobacterales bacterium]